MNALDRKLLRDLVRSRGQVIAVALVMAAGIAGFTGLYGTWRSLEASRDAYYGAYDFAHVFARLERAPRAVGERLAEIPGVARVEVRLAAEALLDVATMSEPVPGRVLSLPGGREPRLDHLHLVAGRNVDPVRRAEALVLHSFAKGHGLVCGDRVSALVDGKRLRLEIVGIVMSPEYVFAVGASGYSDDRRFGVFWIAEPALAAARGAEGTFDDALLWLRPGANEAEVIAAVDRILVPYGGAGAIPRKDQLSHRFVSGEIDQLRAMATRVPIAFLAIAAFLLHIALSRVIATQRAQIGALKALGYRRRTIARHFLEFAAVPIALGVAAGLALGIWFGSSMTRMYGGFFRFPVLRFAIDLDLLVTAGGVSVVAGLLGTLGAVRKAARLPPAEAMRPAAPARYHRGPLSRLGVPRLLSHTGRMVLRELERRPWRALLTTVGISLGVAILILGRFSRDSLDYFTDAEFFRTRRADVTLMFAHPVPTTSALAEVRHLPGVLHAEPFRSVPVRIRHRHVSRDTAITGLPDGADLQRVLDRRGEPVSLPRSGLLLSKALGERLDARPGDRVLVEVREGAHAVREVVVSAWVDDMVGIPAYMRLDALNAFLGEASSANGVLLAVDGDDLDALHARLKDTPAVAGTFRRNAALESFQATTANMTTVTTFFVTLFGIVLAAGVVYSTARVTISERSRDLASLRVLGFTRREISAVLLGELAVYLIVALPLGLLIGRGLAFVILASIDPEQFRWPLLVSGTTDAFAVLVAVGSGLVTALLARRRLDHLDLVAALKSWD